VSTGVRDALAPRDRGAPTPRALGLAILVFVAVAAGIRAGGEPRSAALALIGAAALAGAAAIAWRLPPALIITGGVLLSPFSSHWPLLGIPGALAPDRILLVTGVLCVLLRSRGLGDAPRLTRTGLNWLFAATLAYALVSALAAGTLSDRDAAVQLFERFGVLEFALFLVAPIAFREARYRNLLLIALVALGAYLGATAVFETVGLRQFVFPRYISDPNVGIHFNRGRGPFLEAVTNGTALYLCGLAAAIAVVSWRDPIARLLALGVVGLCAVGIVGTLERSVWLGTIFASCVVLASNRRARAWALPVVATGAVAALAILAVIPGLQAKVAERADNRGTVYDRQNLAGAAIRMAETRPLFGFGWASFKRESQPYFVQDPNYPLTATDEIVHNLVLTYAAEIGLVGLTLWAACLTWGVGSALLIRGPPSLAPWRFMLIGFTAMYLVVANSVFPQVFPNVMIWLLAGIVLSGRVARPARRGRVRDTTAPTGPGELRSPAGAGPSAGPAASPTGTPA
jgi:O-antigen ligase